MNYGQDEQPANDEIVGYITAFNIYDPAVNEITSFKPGSLYAEGNFPVNVKVEHLGNTNVSFDLEARSTVHFLQMFTVVPSSCL